MIAVHTTDCIEELRAQIERIDRELVTLVGQRVEVARRVGSAKRAAGLPTLDPAREAAVLRRAAELARESHLAEEDIRSIFWNVMAISRRAQTEEP